MWSADDLRSHILASYAASDSVGAPPTWVLSKHDVIRHATRLVRADETQAPWVLPAEEPSPGNPVTGLRRARAATTLMLALPGSAYLYQGKELGLPEVLDLPADSRQDSPAFGFGPHSNAWLPQPEVSGSLAVDQQIGDPDSTLELYRQLLRLRREQGLGNGAVRLLDVGVDIVALEISVDELATTVVVNLGDRTWPIPDDATILVASESSIVRELAGDQAVWLERLG